jgi:hypothetical protein
MRNLLALAAAIVVVFLGLGWYLDWYRIKTSTTGEGHREISIDLNTDRINTDVGNKVNNLFGPKDGSTPSTANTAPVAIPVPKATSGTTTGFQRDGSWVYPGGETVTPVPPAGGATLPPPR